MMIRCWNGWNAIIMFSSVSQDCMTSFFVMVESFCMVFWEYKTYFCWFLSVIGGTYVVVNLIADDVWGFEDELTGALSDKVNIWDWPCL